MAYPVTADVTALLTLAGVSYGAADVAGALSSTIREFERRTGWEPFVAETETNHFDPPQRTCDGYVIELGKGLLTATSVTIGMDLSGVGGTVLTAGTEYQLLPYNNGNDTKPYNQLRLLYSSYGLVKSVKVIGSWGYAASCPADVFKAIKEYAAAQIVQQLELKTGAVEKVKQGPVEVQYAKSNAYEVAETAFTRIIKQYRRLTI